MGRHDRPGRNGISERYLERGRYGARYLAPTIDNARDRALPRDALGGYRRGGGKGGGKGEAEHDAVA